MYVATCFIFLGEEFYAKIRVLRLMILSDL